ncbi:MAG: hypothetical protein JSW11_15830 [Candidatus Heimdallarchaeota archaeon]|nr:MAG: hypothetical protein JSW11_15830 [Candidatus Heimdallarchaeota archaeon]
MTSLDTLTSILNQKCSFMAAIQNTPQNILYVVTKENFLKCFPILKRFDLKLRFLEKRKLSLDIHISVVIQEVFFEVTFRVVEYSPSFFQEIVKLLPNADVFIQEILRG